MGTRKALRDISKMDWHSTYEGGASLEQMNAGSLMRIAGAAERQADATEKMAVKYIRMESDLDWYKREYAHRGEEIQRLKNSRAGYMAALTKLRNKIKNGDV